MNNFKKERGWVLPRGSWVLVGRYQERIHTKVGEKSSTPYLCITLPWATQYQPKCTLASFPKWCLSQVKCLGVESTAHATFTPSDAAGEGSASGVPISQQAQSNLTKHSRSQSALLVPHLHASMWPSSQPRAALLVCPHHHILGWPHTPCPVPPRNAHKFWLYQTLPAKNSHPKNPFNSCLHPLTKGSVPGPNKKPIPVSASQVPWDGHKTQQSPLGTTSTSRVTFPFPKILMVVAAPCPFQRGNLG